MKNNKAFHLLATVLAAVGVLAVSTASMYWVHQPKVPNELLKK